jgi:hypothetical protein
MRQHPRNLHGGPLAVAFGSRDALFVEARRCQPLNGNLLVRPFGGGGGGHVFRVEFTCARHIPTNASDVSLSTDFHACLMAGSVFRQIARLHHFSPFSLPSLVAHMDFQAMRSGWLMCSAAPSQPC